MANFTGHEGQDSVIVRGAMHHAVMTLTEFEEWLRAEACTAGAWQYHGGDAQTCLVRRSDGSVRLTAFRVHAEAFETVY